MSAKKLMVIVGDDLNSITGKGEIVERYYNPGDYFDEVELVAIMDDPHVCNPELLAPTAGRARLKITTLQRPGIFGTAGWHPLLLKSWLADSLKKLGPRPDLIRVVGLRLNCLLAVEAKRAFGVPLVASVHEDGHRHRSLEINAGRNLKEKLMRRLFARRLDQIARMALPRCDAVIGVYHCALDYIRRLCRVEPVLIYNAVSANIQPKNDYRLSTPARLLYTGNLVPELKGPLNVIGALAGLDATLDVVGDGPLLPVLMRKSERLGVAHRVNFLGYRQNSWLAGRMREYDIYVYEFHNREISKSVLEALHCGLPVVLNGHPDHPVREFENAEHLLVVEHSAAGFREGIARLMADNVFREKLGIQGREFARGHYNPAEMERRTVELYRSLLAD